jgi:hypothetical protein
LAYTLHARLPTTYTTTDGNWRLSCTKTYPYRLSCRRFDEYYLQLQALPRRTRQA